MAAGHKRWYETLAGILTGIAAVIGAIASLYVAINGKNASNSHVEQAAQVVVSQVEEQARAPVSAPVARSDPGPTSAPQPPEPSTPEISLTSRWRELYPNTGSISQTNQDGDTFTFTVRGVARGLRYESWGNGTIRGLHLETAYQSTVPSTGRCTGAVSPDGVQLNLTCVDSLSGRYETAWIRD